MKKRVQQGRCESCKRPSYTAYCGECVNLMDKPSTGSFPEADSVISGGIEHERHYGQRWVSARWREGS